MLGGRTGRRNPERRDPERDYRLNILRRHDNIEFLAHPSEYTTALAARGFNAAGLFAIVATDASRSCAPRAFSVMPQDPAATTRAAAVSTAGLSGIRLFRTFASLGCR